MPLRPALLTRLLPHPLRAALAPSALFACALFGANSCGPDPYEPQRALATSVAQALVAACPTARLDDADAQQRCADALTNLAPLRDAMGEPFLWGQQSQLWNYDLATFKVTRFNPRVFRRMYLSLFMFPGGFTVEQVGERTVVHVPVTFRNGLDNGNYPYPFWHNPNKWRDYQLAIEMHLVFRNGVLEGALRSAVRLLDRPRTTRDWDGLWRWADGAQPHVSVYASLFSAGNPHLARVDAAYRAFEEGMRPYACTSCHSPDNTQQVPQLTLLVYPNQAVETRATLAAQIEQRLMPPGGGIADDAERAELASLARAFASAADDALAFEGERRAGQSPPSASGSQPSP